jgi:hypothetical protein
MTAWLPRRLQLPNTAAALLALILLPAAGLLLWPRPQAVGLARLLDQAQLMQSFGGSPESPLPGLWQQRLGAGAGDLWRRQRGLWWQFWAVHGDAGAYLVVPTLTLTTRDTARLPIAPLQVDDVSVIAADPLSRQWLADRLRVPARPQRGLEQRCLLQLRRPQVVYWGPGGLAALAGPMAPLLQRLQQGCLALELKDRALQFAGEAAAGTGVLGRTPMAPGPLSQRPLAAGTLLDLRGPSLEVLFQGLLARQLVREPLAERYGIQQSQLNLLRRLPFGLRLQELARGPFQASLQLDLMPRRQDHRSWSSLLAGLRQPLQQQGLQEPTPQLQAAGARLGTGVLPSAIWSADDGTVVGGWLWKPPLNPRADSSLLLFLGPPPPAGPALAPDGSGGDLWLRARPADLSRLGLWPQGFPALIRQAEQLELMVSGGAAEPISQLRGRLVLPRPR